MESGELEDRVMVVATSSREASEIPSEIVPQGHHLGDGQVLALIDDRFGLAPGP